MIRIAKKEGPANAIVNAKAIVSTRNDLQNSLDVISESLNNEIDILKAQIGEREKSARGVSNRQIYETIEILFKKWPSKKTQIEYAGRKVLAEMGLDKI